MLQKNSFFIGRQGAILELKFCVDLKLEDVDTK